MSERERLLARLGTKPATAELALLSALDGGGIGTVDHGYLPVAEASNYGCGAATAACTLMLEGCRGTPAINLRPDNIPQGHGAVFGRVEVFKGKSDVTGACFITFTDENNEDKASLSLNNSGWVMTALNVGPTYLSFINCAVWNGLMYGTRQLRFDVIRHHSQGVLFSRWQRAVNANDAGRRPLQKPSCTFQPARLRRPAMTCGYFATRRRVLLPEAPDFVTASNR